MALNVSNHNGSFLDLKSIPRVLYSTNFTFIYHVLTVYYEESECSRAYQQAYVIAVLA